MQGRKWFCAKTHGIGWYPCSWHGWLTLGVFALVVLATRWFYEGLAIEVWEREVLFFLTVLGHLMLLLGICTKKGEPLKWRWGDA